MNFWVVFRGAGTVPYKNSSLEDSVKSMLSQTPKMPSYIEMTKRSLLILKLKLQNQLISPIFHHFPSEAQN